MSEKELFSSVEAARIIGISRIAVFKKIKSGEIKAQKVGRNFVITKNELERLLKGSLNEEKKRNIERAVKRTIKEYGETLKLLGKE